MDLSTMKGKNMDHNTKNMERDTLKWEKTDHYIPTEVENNGHYTPNENMGHKNLKEENKGHYILLEENYNVRGELYTERGGQGSLYIYRSKGEH